MVTLEQIRQLDARVHRAVEVISKLRDENTTLKNRLGEYQERIEELEVLISNFKEDQSEIENGITSALTQLAAIEESSRSPSAERPAQRPAPNQPAPAEPAAAVQSEEAEAGEQEETGGDQDAELDIF